ncbi:MAG TPA: Gfo/Idh/MocA family oxidoreductase [Candidatus Sulfotelmatobacter sp.]|nr:Gfo/Idh/MocA family oxidoreductase [Candidatus Sulfotelmatobacter sp.]
MGAKLGIGVLGVGDMGRRHAHNLRCLVPAARLVAVADVAEKRAQQVAQELEIAHSFRSLEEMLGCKDLQAVLIASPDKFHAQGIQAAAAAGKDILCEKPIATNLADAHAALEAVAKAGVRLQIGFMRHYDPAYEAAMKRVEAGEIGEPVVFKSIGRDKDLPPISAYQSGVNGMLFYNSTIHDFDLARWMMRDEVREVQAYTTVAIRQEIEQYGDIVAGVVNLKYVRGAIGNVESYVQGLYGYDVRTEVIGSKGSVFVGSLHKTPATFLSGNGGTADLADHFLSRFADAYLAQDADFVENIVHEHPVRVSGEDGLKALELAVAAERSHLQRRPVAVSPN